MRSLVFLAALGLAGPGVPTQDRPVPTLAESPNIKVLTGLLVPDFVTEMELMVQALGVNCQFCHVPNNFAAETNEHKITARRMIEMTKLINKQFFPDVRGSSSRRQPCDDLFLLALSCCADPCSCLLEEAHRRLPVSSVLPALPRTCGSCHRQPT